MEHCLDCMKSSINCCQSHRPVRVMLLGGPFHGRIVSIAAAPPRIEIADSLYHRLNDPDTEEFLGGYVYDDPMVQGKQEREGARGELRLGRPGQEGTGGVMVRVRDSNAHLGRRHARLLRHLRKTDQLNPCNWKAGARDSDGHAWASTMMGIIWKWKCLYCGKRSRSDVRPDKREK